MAAIVNGPTDTADLSVSSVVDGRLIAGRFRLLEPLGRGGMGRVFRARDELLHRSVAVKLIYDDAIADSDVRHACALEARAAARLNHPGIVRILDSGFDDGHLYVVMSLAEGQTLSELLRADGPLPASQALGIAAQVADALQAAHLEGIVHCDVKPGNLIVRADGRVQLVDFGIARIAASTTNLDSASLQGSAEYVAPEQVEGGHVDARTDLYALGVVLFEMLTGKTPFGGGTLAAVLARRLVAEPPSVRASHPELPAAVDRVVQRLMARDPAERYQSAADAHAALIAAQSLVLADGLPKPPNGQATATMPLGAALLAAAGRRSRGMGGGGGASGGVAAARAAVSRWGLGVSAIAAWAVSSVNGPRWRGSVQRAGASAWAFGRRVQGRSASRKFLAVGIVVAALLGLLIGTLAASGQEQASLDGSEVAGAARTSLPPTVQPPTPVATSPATAVPTPTAPAPTPTIAEPAATTPPAPTLPPLPTVAAAPPEAGPSSEGAAPPDRAPAPTDPGAAPPDTATAPPARVLAAPVPQPEPPAARPAAAKPAAAKPEEKKPSVSGPPGHGSGNPKPAPGNGRANGNGQKKR